MSRAPRRIKRWRTKGWVKPADTIIVTRPGKWGNPFVVHGLVDLAQLAKWGWKVTDSRMLIGSEVHAVDWFRQMLLADPAGMDRVRAELRGHDLCCWCDVDRPCHGDVLLELANAPLPATKGKSS